MGQTPHPTFINMPLPRPEGADTAETPGTPTSTTTSLSALSTIAIKDGHRGHVGQTALGREPSNFLSANNLEAERADRISRLAGLERVSPLRAPPQHSPALATTGSSPNALSVSSGGFAANLAGGLGVQFHNGGLSLTPAYFDAGGQPVSATKISTVGTASASEASLGDGEDACTTTELQDDDLLSTDANSRGNYNLDEDEGMANRSVGGFEDHLSDDGNSSLVGFGEGAGSTVSGPIYQRRPAPAPASSSGPPGPPGPLERSSSGVSEGYAAVYARREREREYERERDHRISGLAKTPATVVPIVPDIREPRLFGSPTVDSEAIPPEERFVDTAARDLVSDHGAPRRPG